MFALTPTKGLTNPQTKNTLLSEISVMQPSVKTALLWQTSYMQWVCQEIRRLHSGELTARKCKLLKTWASDIGKREPSGCFDSSSTIPSTFTMTFCVMTVTVWSMSRRRSLTSFISPWMMNASLLSDKSRAMAFSAVSFKILVSPLNCQRHCASVIHFRRFWIFLRSSWGSLCNSLWMAIVKIRSLDLDLALYMAELVSVQLISKSRGINWAFGCHACHSLWEIIPIENW